MFRRKSFLLVSVFLIASLTACNMPSGTEPTVDLAGTVTAQALLLESGSGGNAPQQELPTATPAFTATPELTGTPSVPEITVSVNTNCRTGPGTAYQIIGALVIGQKGIVVGKNSPTGYWIINNPGSTGTCWLFPQYATVSGDTSKLQEYAIPPTPTPTFTSTPTATPTLASPAPVNNVNITMVCTPDGINFKHSGTLTWEDKSNNEDGFNIYVNGTLIASIPANSVSYNVPQGSSMAAGIASIFEVEAFNAAGQAAKKSVTRGCP
ncbi:MAG: hypothetical protein IT309_06360 [Anaerolineales bacterium]|jgi:hypothetical protein|nr:hypothetical protein [Anaerolineales bacterium]